jgi:hypothetical protein
MNLPIIIAVVSGVVFILGPLLLRSSAVLIFLALCAGDLFVRLASPDVTRFAASALPVRGYPILFITQVALLLAIPLVIMVAYKRSVKPASLPLMIVPAIASAMICFMLVVAMLPYDSRELVEKSNLYSLINPFFEPAVVAGMVFSAIYLVIAKPTHEKNKKRHK